jgi:hypothetical protein
MSDIFHFHTISSPISSSEIDWTTIIIKYLSHSKTFTRRDNIMIYVVQQFYGFIYSYTDTDTCYNQTANGRHMVIALKSKILIESGKWWRALHSWLLSIIWKILLFPIPLMIEHQFIAFKVKFWQFIRSFRYFKVAIGADRCYCMAL